MESPVCDKNQCIRGVGETWGCASQSFTGGKRTLLWDQEIMESTLGQLQLGILQQPGTVRVVRSNK